MKKNEWGLNLMRWWAESTRLAEQGRDAMPEQDDDGVAGTPHINPVVPAEPTLPVFSSPLGLLLCFHHLPEELLQTIARD